MRTQQYRHRITFQERIETRDPDTGAVDYVWDTVLLEGKLLQGVPAQVLTGPGREAIVSENKMAETSARINTRWFEGLNPKWRIVWNGLIGPDGNPKFYDITSIEVDITARREYRLRCSEGLNDGA